VLDVTAPDVARVLAELPGHAVERERPRDPEHAYLDRLIVKPWGHELRVYDDAFIDIWRLAIAARHGTSLHVHPRKDTYLICIGGDAVLSRDTGEQITLVEGSVVVIRAGVLHETFSERGVDLLEVELPRDKLDVVRAGDRYGRAGQRYERAAESRPQPCPLEPFPAGPPHARVRSHCATGCFRFRVEWAHEARQDVGDLVAAIPLDTASVLRRHMEVLDADTIATADNGHRVFTVRSNHR
jgi:mannose-6-phosphate isomerase-like protein (cupin superfamily)